VAIQMMSTKLTGQTAALALSLRSSLAGVPAGGVSLSGVCGGLDLDTTSVAGACGATGALRTSVITDCGTGSGVGTGLSLGWVSVDASSPRVMRGGRPTEAPKAAAVAARHGAYLQVIGAGATQKQDEQLINQAEAAFIGAEAVRSRAFRGPEPWRERT
jgi:hypothetical protein